MFSSFPVHETSLPDWDYFPDPFSVFSQEPDYLSPEPILSNSGSDNSTPNQYQVEPYREGTMVIDERKRKRMVSNRESARRSRMRKQKHLENLRTKASRLRESNQDLVNRFGLVTRHLHVVRTDNDRLRNESVVLRHRLWTLQQVMLVRELQNQIPSHTTWPYNNMMMPIIQEILP